MPQSARSAIFVRAAISIFLILVSSSAEATPRPQQLTIADPLGQPLEIGIWTPEGATGVAPLIVISHGSGGDYRSHADTAQALAEAGFVVAAITHSGDNWRDPSMASAVWQRPRHLRLLVDYMLTSWSGRAGIDPRRIGAFGFSSGGFTVLVAAGGVPDLGRIRAHCRAHPAFFDCRIAASAPATRPSQITWTRDDRIRAIVVAAPALGFTFSSAGLADVRVPVQLWRADADQILPHPFYAEAVRTRLPRRADYRVVPRAGHFDFLSPCPAALAPARPELCTSLPGFDRDTFHLQLNGAVTTFFRQHLAGAVAN